MTQLDVKNKSRTEQILKQLKEDDWVDMSTRSVLVSLSTYNPSLRLVMAVRLQVEFFESGNILPRLRTYPVRVHLFDRSEVEGHVQLWGTVLLGACMIAFIVTEFVRYVYHWQCGRLLASLCLYISSVEVTKIYGKMPMSFESVSLQLESVLLQLETATAGGDPGA